MISRPESPELCEIIRPRKTRRAQGRPGADRTRGCVQKARGSHHRYGPNNRPPLRDGFTAYTCSPQGPAILPLSAAGLIGFRDLDASIGAPGPHDFTVRMMPSVRARKHTATSSRPPHPAPDVRDDAYVPLVGQDDAEYAHILKIRNRNIFHRRAGQLFAEPARRPNHLARLRQEGQPSGVGRCPSRAYAIRPHVGSDLTSSFPGRSVTFSPLAACSKWAGAEKSVS